MTPKGQEQIPQTPLTPPPTQASSLQLTVPTLTLSGKPRAITLPYLRGNWVHTGQEALSAEKRQSSLQPKALLPDRGRWVRSSHLCSQDRDRPCCARGALRVGLATLSIPPPALPAAATLVLSQVL